MLVSRFFFLFSAIYSNFLLLKGTMLYMSPEQFNNGKYDYKVDIYSLGLIFFELLVPFATESERVKVLTNIKKHDYPKGFKEKYPNEACTAYN